MTKRGKSRVNVTPFTNFLQVTVYSDTCVSNLHNFQISPTNDGPFSSPALMRLHKMIFTISFYTKPRTENDFLVSRLFFQATEVETN